MKKLGKSYLIGVFYVLFLCDRWIFNESTHTQSMVVLMLSVSTDVALKNSQRMRWTHFVGQFIGFPLKIRKSAQLICMHSKNLASIIWCSRIRHLNRRCRHVYSAHSASQSSSQFRIAHFKRFIRVHSIWTVCVQIEISMPMPMAMTIFNSFIWASPDKSK